MDEEEEFDGRDGRDGAEVESKPGPPEDLLACHKCKQFGHLGFQCLNMFSNQGQRQPIQQRYLLTGPETETADTKKTSEEEMQERLMTEKATELM